MENVAKIKESPNRLARIVKGKIERPIRVVIAGVDGLGKSTFAAAAPDPVFIGAEDGTAQLDVARMPDVNSWSDIIACLIELATSTHPYKTVVVDTLDWAEPKCWAEVCKKNGKKKIEDLPYGRGYAEALDEWRSFLELLDTLRDRKQMNVILVSHVWIKTFKNPEAVGDYDRFEMKLHAKASGLMREWADCVLFGAYETYSTEINGRVKGFSTGARIIHTQRTAAWDAKNRYNLPPTLPLDWQAFSDAVAANRPADPEVTIARISKLLEGADADYASKVNAAVENNKGDAVVLAKIANKVAAQAAIKEKNNG